MSKIIIISNEDGSFVLGHASLNAMQSEEAEEDFYNRVAIDMAAGRKWELVDEIPAIVAAQIASERNKATILQQLTSLDSQKVRAISDAILTGDNSRLKTLEAQAAALRAALPK